MTTAVLDPRRALTPKWTKDQVELMKRTVAKGTTDDEFKLFLYTCKRVGLDPFVKQVYAIKRYDSESNSYIMGIQLGIDGLRLIAARTDELAGIDEAKHVIDPNEPWHPSESTVTVYRMQNGERNPYTHTVRWKEYAQKKKDGSLTRMWSEQGMPFNQLGKCAEAGALRKAFPNDLSGLTTHDESPIIDISAADNMKIEEPKVETKPEELCAGQLTAYAPKDPQKKTPHRLTLLLDNGAALTLGTYELPPAFKDPLKMLGKRVQFSYEEKPNPRGGEPFRNLKHLAIEEHDPAAEEAKREEPAKKEAEQSEPEKKPAPADPPAQKGPRQIAADKAFADFKSLLESAPDVGVLEDVYTGSITKNWHVCTPGQRLELSDLYGELKKKLTPQDAQ